MAKGGHTISNLQNIVKEFYGKRIHKGLFQITITDATYTQVLGPHKVPKKKKRYERKMVITICIQKQ